MVLLPGILRRRKAIWHQAIAALALMVFLLSIPALFGVQTRARIGFVLQEDTPLRLTPTLEAQPMTRLAPGEPARWIRARGRYVLVRTSRTLGWVEQDQFGLTCPTHPAARISESAGQMTATASTTSNGAHPARDDGEHRTKQVSDQAGLEAAQLVRGADEEAVDGGDAPALLIRREELHQRVPHHDADVVHRAAEEEHEKGEPEPARAAERNRGQLQTPRPPDSIARPAFCRGGRCASTSAQSSEPIGSAAWRKPRPVGPTSRMSLA